MTAAATESPETPDPREVSDCKAKVSIRNLDCRCDSTHILTSLSINIHANAVTAIIGPSGCGKSTVLKCINRMVDFSTIEVKGKVCLDGTDVRSRGYDVVDLRRKVGMIFQQPNPFPKSIFENVAYGPRIKGRCRKSELDEIVQEALERANLWKEVKDHLSRNAQTLSGGQQQRLCIARVLAVQPEVLLLDEPCSAVDPTSMRKIEDLMHELKKSYTLVIATHNLEQMRRVSDFTAFISPDEGGGPTRLVEFGRTAEMIVSPKDPRTEDYIRRNCRIG